MEVINCGMIQKIMVAGNELTNIFDNIGEEIEIDIKPWKFKGKLIRVTSKRIKDKNGDYETYKEMIIEIESISVSDSSGIDPFFSFPDKKQIFTDIVKIII